jgi:MoxR-like ATPase
MDCKRIQFTPDLMPSDILGTNVFNLQTSHFEFRRGPVFTDILVADEINRTPPKTQSALLEVMEEKTVTIDGISQLRRIRSSTRGRIACRKPSSTAFC